MPHYDGLSNHIQLTSDIPMRSKRQRVWPYVFILGFVVGILVGCSL